jgi:hypothetical protein
MLTCEPLPRYSAAFSACLPHSVHWIAVDSSSRAVAAAAPGVADGGQHALGDLAFAAVDEFELDGPGQVRVTLDDLKRLP